MRWTKWIPYDEAHFTKAATKKIAKQQLSNIKAHFIPRNFIEPASIAER